MACLHAFDQGQAEWVVDVVRDVNAALDLLNRNEHPFDVILSDYRLQGMDALDLFQRTRAAGIAIPFILMTGVGSEALAADALKAGIDHYVIKTSDNRYFDELPELTHRIVASYRNRLELNRMEEALAVSVERKRVTSKLAIRALAGDDLKQLLTDTLASMAASLNAEFCSLLEILPGGEVLQVSAVAGWPARVVGTTFPMGAGSGQFGYTLASTETVVVADMRTEGRFEGPSLLAGHGVVSGMSFVVGDVESPLGVLAVHTAEPRTFSEKDTSFGESVASLIALALDRVRLMESLQTANSELEKRVQERTLELAGQNRVLQMLAQGAELGEVLTELTRSLEHVDGEWIASIMILDEDQCLHLAAHNRLPPRFAQAIAKLVIGPEVGACGACAYHGERVVIEDILTHPNCTGVRELAAESGLRACWSEPIFSSQREVLGTFANYDNGSRAPNEQQIQRIRDAAHLAGIAIEHANAKAELSRHQEHLAHMGRVSLAGEMASGIAHEVNQPLQSISLHSELCLRALDSGGLQDGEQVIRQSLKDIHTQAQRAGRILNTLRSFVRNRGPCRDFHDSDEVIAFAVGLARHAAEKAHVPIRTEPSSNMPLLFIDRTQIEQLLLNLIHNAIEALAESGQLQPQVVVRTSHLEEQSAVRIDVCDNGPGVDPAELERIFDGFFTTKRDGMGLGLAICRTIVNNHAGSIEALNNPDCGLTVRCTLPIRSER